MTELDKACKRLEIAVQRDRKANSELSRIYRGTFRDRSGLSDADFNQRKSTGRYSWK